MCDHIAHSGKVEDKRLRQRDAQPACKRVPELSRAKTVKPSFHQGRIRRNAPPQKSLSYRAYHCRCVAAAILRVVLLDLRRCTVRIPREGTSTVWEWRDRPVMTSRGTGGLAPSSQVGIRRKKPTRKSVPEESGPNDWQ